ncbi:MAG: DUF4261 domain-containing protein [Anaerolineae bacterium]|nr:DUF4261 domain-containing protein [Thermoflexales bacterium]MDW8408035.1 DUF4261 domain-containing protein [Anaerolineae bacterium]
MSKSVRIVLCIPGPWDSRAALAQQIGEQRGTSYDGAALRISDYSARAELVEHDAELRDSFARSSRLLSADDLEAIARHRSAVYLIGEGGSVDAARSMMGLAEALLWAGGLAVKVETSGLAHRAKDWLQHAARRETHIGALLIAYVALVAGKTEVYSCGMHNLGFPDAVLSGALAPQHAAQLLKDFLLHVLHERPALRDGQIFSVVGEAERFVLSHEPCRLFASDDLFFNPFGMWRLTLLVPDRSTPI